uniref:Uncharacterized protein n=1 Tax=Panagrolaimus sp. PS1159 TaxID=55785 RepID=A0AC35G9A7_9BILA
MSIIIPIPSEDNGNLMKLLASQNLEFSVTNASFSSVMALIYNPSAKASPSRTSKAAKTVIVNGNTEIHSKLATNGYTNYSFTVKSYYEIVSQLF